MRDAAHWLQALSLPEETSIPSQCESPNNPPAARQIAWFHPPKSGTSFGTLLVHLANSSSLPDKARMHSCSLVPTATKLPLEAYLDPDDSSVYEEHKCHGATDRFALQYSYDQYFPGVFWGTKTLGTNFPGCKADQPQGRTVGGYELCRFATCGDEKCDFGAHRFMCEHDLQQYNGSFYGLWREPARMVASNYIRSLDNVAYQSQYDTSDPAFRKGLLEFANSTRAKITKLLAGAYPASANGMSVWPEMLHMAPGGLWQGHPPAEPLMPIASERLRTAFAFVGLTDDYSRTACLFHLTFGGHCTEFELENNRNTVGTSTTEVADILTAEGYSDPIDAQLYHIAQQRFDADARRLNLTSERCAAIQCPL